MRWGSVGMAVLVAALFLGPLWAIGELGVWSFKEPRSHLRWDEAGERPGSQAPPRAADTPGGATMLAAELLVAPLLLAFAWSCDAVLRGRRRGRAGGDRA